MYPTLPNLFALGVDGPMRIYQIYLARMPRGWASENPDADQIVDATEQIRAYSVGTEHEAFAPSTSMHAIYALMTVGRWEDAWALCQSVNADRDRYGILAEYDESFMAVYRELPILVQLGRAADAAQTMERLLSYALDNWASSYRFAPLVIETHHTTPSPMHVSLESIYAALDRDLSSWLDWPRFVDKLHDIHVSIGGVDRDELRANPALLKDLFDRVRQRADEGRDGLTDEEADLIEARRESKEEIRQQIAATEPSRQRVRARVDTQLRLHFPWMFEEDG
ncbi:MAG: hypothetical protein AAF432_04905 [Planctomycetota bacterium]